MAKEKIQNFGYWVLFGMLTWPLMVTYGPRLEGTLRPVVVSTHLTRVLPDEDNWSVIYGDSRKVRDCTFIGMEWYYGKPRADHVLVPLEILEPSRIRNNGEFGFGPWRINLSSDLVREKSFAIVRHRCHPFWVTETHFWP